MLQRRCNLCHPTLLMAKSQILILSNHHFQDSKLHAKLWWRLKRLLSYVLLFIYRFSGSPEHVHQPSSISCSILVLRNYSIWEGAHTLIFTFLPCILFMLIYSADEDPALQQLWGTMCGLTQQLNQITYSSFTLELASSTADACAVLFLSKLKQRRGKGMVNMERVGRIEGIDLIICISFRKREHRNRIRYHNLVIITDFQSTTCTIKVKPSPFSYNQLKPWECLGNCKFAAGVSFKCEARLLHTQHKDLSMFLLPCLNSGSQV